MVLLCRMIMWLWNKHCHHIFMIQVSFIAFFVLCSMITWYWHELVITLYELWFSLYRYRTCYISPRSDCSSAVQHQPPQLCALELPSSHRWTECARVSWWIDGCKFREIFCSISSDYKECNCWGWGPLYVCWKCREWRCERHILSHVWRYCTVSYYVIIVIK